MPLGVLVVAHDAGAIEGVLSQFVNPRVDGTHGVVDRAGNLVVQTACAARQAFKGSDALELIKGQSGTRRWTSSTVLAPSSTAWCTMSFNE